MTNASSVKLWNPPVYFFKPYTTTNCIPGPKPFRLALLASTHRLVTFFLVHARHLLPAGTLGVPAFAARVEHLPGFARPRFLRVQWLGTQVPFPKDLC